MNIVEKEAIDYFEDKFYSSGEIANLENFKSLLTSKLYNFNRDRDKLDFLKILYDLTKVDLAEHMKTCIGCGYEGEKKTALLAIKQEIESINKFYSEETNDLEKFNLEEELKLHTKLNSIMEKLDNQFLAQQVIFEELDELKSHFNLGKKSWFQLLKGKLIDLTIEKALEITIVAEIFNELREGFDRIPNMIDK